MIKNSLNYFVVREYWIYLLRFFLTESLKCQPHRAHMSSSVRRSVPFATVGQEEAGGGDKKSGVL